MFKAKTQTTQPITNKSLLEAYNLGSQTEHYCLDWKDSIILLNINKKTNRNKKNTFHKEFLDHRKLL